MGVTLRLQTAPLHSGSPGTGRRLIPRFPSSTVHSNTLSKLARLLTIWQFINLKVRVAREGSISTFATILSRARKQWEIAKERRWVYAVQTPLLDRWFMQNREHKSTPKAALCNRERNWEYDQRKTMETCKLITWFWSAIFIIRFPGIQKYRGMDCTVTLGCQNQSRNEMYHHQIS